MSTNSAAEAALARARVAATASPSAPGRGSVDIGKVRECSRRFNAELNAIPDYLHTHPSKVKDAVALLKKVHGDIVAFGGKNPKDASKPLRLKCTAFVNKVHGLEHAQKALLLLGFREQVDHLEKYYVYCGAIPSSGRTQDAFLDKVGGFLNTALEGVEKHLQSTESSRIKRLAEETARREYALAAIEDDRQGVRARADAVVAAALSAETHARSAAAAAGLRSAASGGLTQSDEEDEGVRRRGRVPFEGGHGHVIGSNADDA